MGDHCGDGKTATRISATAHPPTCPANHHRTSWRGRHI
jgi:hypothetical protein